MSKASEFANITWRNIRGDKEIGEDGYNMFSTIASPYSTAFAEKLEEASDVDGKEARRRYIRAFLYGLKKVLPEEQFMKIRNGMKSDHDISCITLGTASQLLKQKQKFEKLKELFPWDGAERFETQFFSIIQQKHLKCEAHKEYQRQWAEKNFLKCKEIGRRSRAKNRDKNIERQRRFREANREEYNKYHREWFMKNREKYNERRRQRIAETREIHNAKEKRWREENRDKCKAYYAKYRAKHREELNAKQREYMARKKAEKQAAVTAGTAASEGMALQNAAQPISYT